MVGTWRYNTENPAVGATKTDDSTDRRNPNAPGDSHRRDSNRSNGVRDNAREADHETGAEWLTCAAADPPADTRGPSQWGPSTLAKGGLVPCEKPAVSRQAEGMQIITAPGQALRGPHPRPRRPRAGRWATVGRFALGGYFLLMAGVNMSVTLPNADATYDGLAELSWPHFAWVPELISGPLALPFTVFLIVWEVVVGVLLLSRGRAVRIALWAALFQMVALAPFLGWYELANLATAVLVAALLTRDHTRTVSDVVHRREQSGN